MKYDELARLAKQRIVKMTKITTVPDDGAEPEPVWWERRHGALEINPRIENEYVRVNIGVSQTVEVEKLYGPAVVSGIRVRVDLAAYQWVVEQEHIIQLDEGDEIEWREVARLPCFTIENRESGQVPGGG